MSGVFMRNWSSSIVRIGLGRERFVAAWTASLLGVFAGSPASAVDGVLEINQTCATTTGCFPGDAPGFPVTISGSAGRSVRLTSDLAVGDPNVDGIEITVARVEIDFNGFSLVCYSLGSGTAKGVTGTGTNGSFARYTTLRNGVIRGARNLGVALAGAEDVRLERMTVEFSSGGGVALGHGAQIVDSRFTDNGSISLDAVVVGDRAILRGNSIDGSGGRGLVAGKHAVVEGNVVTASGGDGIDADFGSVLARNASASNGGRGIVSIDGGATVVHNAVASNGGDGIRVGQRSGVIGNAVNANAGDGIEAGAACNVRENTVTGNAMTGLNLTPTVVYSQNLIVGGGAGSTTVSGGVDAGDNLCGATIGCP
ncbi:MAG: right-handed parallel beta-helix repeat-containing protein [Myxococcota bacterium]